MPRLLGLKLFLLKLLILKLLLHKLHIPKAIIRLLIIRDLILKLLIIKLFILILTRNQIHILWILHIPPCLQKPSLEPKPANNIQFRRYASSLVKGAVRRVGFGKTVERGWGVSLNSAGSVSSN